MNSRSSQGSLTSLRRIGDDPMLRPFLNSLFDPQSYVKNIIREGKTDDCFAAITEYTEKIDDEIQRYIAQNKESLMSGMQDINSLASRYYRLSGQSNLLLDNIQRLRGEISDPYNAIRCKTLELDHLQQASELLSRLRRFVRAKSALDLYLRTDQRSEEVDQDLSLHREETKDSDPRSLASAAKLVAELENLIQHPQLLRIHFVRDSEGQIKSFGIKLRKIARERLFNAVTTRAQADAGSYLQVFHNLGSLREAVVAAVDNEVSSCATSAEASLSSHIPNMISVLESIRTTSGTSISSTPGSAPATKRAAVPLTASVSAPTSSQVRSVARETAHSWASSILASTSSIVALQRVLRRKVDPTTQFRFFDALPSSERDLVHLFWTRLSVELEDCCMRRLRASGEAEALIRIYPCLRNATLEVVSTISTSIDNTDNNPQSAIRTRSDNYERLNFGASFWSDEDIFGGMLSSKFFISTGVDRFNISLDISEVVDHPLLQGLRLLRDRYLLSALDRMTFPVMQMFPELEGYIAAVPSKRDLATLTRAVQIELISASIEGDIGLVKAVAKEASKAIALLLTKVEGMAIAPGAITGPTRSSAQEHNAQLMTLCIQIKEALERIPSLASQQLDESSIVGTAGKTPQKLGSISHMNASSSKSTFDAELIRKELERQMSVPTSQVDVLARRYLIEPLLRSMVDFVLLAIVPIHREIPTDSSSSSTSQAIKQLESLLPNLLQSHLLSLPTGNVSGYAAQELALRIISAYITVSSLIRPVNDAGKMRIAADISLLEATLSSSCDLSIASPVLRESRAYLRFIFEDDNTFSSGSNILALTYICDMRPSTILSCMCARASPILPMPHLHDVSIHEKDLEKELIRYSSNLLIPFFKEDISGGGERLSVSSLGISGLYVSGGIGWRSIRSELEAWSLVQRCLEIFCQRIATIKDKEERARLRSWYEAVLNIGAHFFK